MEKKQQNISYFVSFCVEQYKHAKKLAGSEAMAQLDRYGVLDYLAENYEIQPGLTHQLFYLGEPARFRGRRF